MTITTRRKTIRLSENKGFAGRTARGKVVCKHCQSDELWKNGKRPNGQLYKCKICGKQFVDNGCLPGDRTRGEVISKALNFYFRCGSLTDTVVLVKDWLGVKINRTTIWRWIQKYAPIVSKAIQKLKIDVGGQWHADEMQYKVKGKKYWFWDCIDYQTRYIISCNISRTRTMKAAVAFFKRGIAHSLRKPVVIVTDGCGVYKRGIRKSMWRSILGGETVHIPKVGLQARDGSKLSQIPIERFHNTVKQRYKVTRHMGSVDGSNAWLEGFVIHYNFLRIHSTIGTTPAKMAGARYGFERGWGDLIQWALKN